MRDDWDIPIVDYWDQMTGSINRGAIRLSKLSGPERVAACGRIRDAVGRRAQSLADINLLKAAVSMVDDLYKYVNDEVLMDQALFDYIDAFGRTLANTVRKRGYVIRYVVENQFLSLDFLMLGPFDLFPKVFNAAGLVYICPQQLGLQLMQADGIAATDYETAIPRYITEARHVCNRLASDCQDDNRHYVFLEADYEEGALDVALRGGGDPGVLSVFRDDAPVPGSMVSVGFPEQKLGG
jgi:hypothetical protein